MSKRIIYGGNAEFHCVSHGIPKPLIVWYKKSHLKMEIINTTDTTKFFIAPNGTLFISKVDYNDVKMYQCFSVSPGGLTRNVSVELDVYGTYLSSFILLYI